MGASTSVDVSALSSRRFGAGDLRVQGGFVRNNGTITGTGDLVIDYLGLVKGAGDRVYQISAGQRRWVSTAAVFAARGFNWSQVHFIADAALNAFPEGGALT